MRSTYHNKELCCVRRTKAGSIYAKAPILRSFGQRVLKTVNFRTQLLSKITEFCPGTRIFFAENSISFILVDQSKFPQGKCGKSRAIQLAGDGLKAKQLQVR